MKTLDSVRLALTPEVNVWLKANGKHYGSLDGNFNTCLFWFNNSKYVLFYDKPRVNSPKHQPKISFKHFQALLLMPTGEARLEYAKTVIKRKW